VPVVTERRARGAFVVAAGVLAVVIAVPALFAPPGREGFALEAAVAALLHGHRVALPPLASPGMLALVALGERMSATPGRGVRVLAFLATLALGPLLARAFTPSQKPPAKTTLAVAALAASWFASVFVDFDAAARGPLFAHTWCALALASAGRPLAARRGGGSALAALAFGAAVATSLRVLPMAPLLVWLTAARSSRGEGARVLAASLVFAALSLAAFSTLSGASLLSTLALASPPSFFASFGAALVHLRPTAGFVVVCALLVALGARPEGSDADEAPGWQGARRARTPVRNRRATKPLGDGSPAEGSLPSGGALRATFAPRAAEERALVVYGLLAATLAFVPFADGLARLESMVPALAVSALVVARAHEESRAWRRLAAGALVVLGIGVATTATDADSKSRGNRPTRRYVGRASAVLRALAAHDENALLASYASPRTAFYPAEARAISLFLADVSPGEELRVLPDAPEIYRYTGLYPAKGSSLAAAASEAAALAERPRWIVTGSTPPNLPAYAPRATFPHHIVFERVGP